MPSQLIGLDSFGADPVLEDIKYIFDAIGKYITFLKVNYSVKPLLLPQSDVKLPRASADGVFHLIPVIKYFRRWNYITELPDVKLGEELFKIGFFIL